MTPNLAVQNLIVIYSRNNHEASVGHIKTVRQLQSLSKDVQSLGSLGYTVTRQNHSLKCLATIATSVGRTH
jgi:transketolase N-terminal domain/subunit